MRNWFIHTTSSGELPLRKRHIESVTSGLADSRSQLLLDVQESRHRQSPNSIFGSLFRCFNFLFKNPGSFRIHVEAV